MTITSLFDDLPIVSHDDEGLASKVLRVATVAHRASWAASLVRQELRSFDLRLRPVTRPESTRMPGPRAEVVTKVSPWSVSDTVARLKAVAEARGIKLLEVIDLTSAAKAVGVELRETQLITLGGTASEVARIAAHPLAAIDLPRKIVVWADGYETKVSYISTQDLAARYQLIPELTSDLRDIDLVIDMTINR